MPIDSSEIDPRIAALLREREAELLGTTSSTTSAELEAVFVTVEMRRVQEMLHPGQAGAPSAEAVKRAEAALLKHGAKKGATWGQKFGMLATGAAACGGGYLAGKFGWHGLYEIIPYALGGVLALGGAGVTLRRRRKDAAGAGGAVVYPADVLDALLDLLPLSPVEKRYGELLTLLAREPSPLDASGRRDLLTQINGLLDDARKLAAHRAEMGGSVDDDALRAMRADRDRLLAESEQVDDPVVWDTKRQSAKMLEQRMEDARSVRQIVTRMEAQEEAIYQTMGSLHSSLARLTLAPTRMGLTAPDVTGLHETINAARRQAHAVEQAVQEVASLSARGG